MFKQSLLISNILDPLTKNTQDLEKMYTKLAQTNHYQSIETRIIIDNQLIKKFNDLCQQTQWKVVCWITGELSRKGCNLSSLSQEMRKQALQETYSLLDQAAKMHCDWVGIASGTIEDSQQIDIQILNFSMSIQSINEYIKKNHYPFKLLIEPLDGFAHKKNVIGSLTKTLQLINILEEKNLLANQQVSFCWDSAHVALNEDDFDLSIQTLIPYLSRIHLADIVSDKTNAEYGDYHREFDDKGIMNKDMGKLILSLFEKYKDSNQSFYLACEVRTKDINQAWVNEQKYREFIKAIL